MPRRHLSVVVVLGAVLAVITACSGQSSPSASGSPRSSAAAGSSQALAPQAVSVPGAPTGGQVEDAVKSAFAGATAVHIKGTLTNNTGTLSLDLQLNKNNTASGTISEGGASIPLLAVNGVDYVQFTPSVISESDNTQVGELGAALTNKWVPGTSSLASDLVSGITPLLSLDGFTSAMFGGQSDQTPTLTGTDVVNDVPVLSYESSDGSTVYIAKSTPHYLLRMTAPSSGSGSLDFTGWNQPVAVTAPPAAQIYTGAGA